MINLFNWVTTLVESFTFYGGGKGGGGSTSTSTSTPVDFFGKDARAPYANLLSQLLLGPIYSQTSSGSNSNSRSAGSGVSGYNSNYISPANSVQNIQNTPREDLLGGSIYSSYGPQNTGPNYASTPGSRNSNQTNTNQPAYQSTSILDLIKSTPGYQFRMDQGQQALGRKFAATGTGPSGAENLALLNYGQGFAADAYQQLISNLMAPSGASLIGNTQSSSSQSTGASPIPGAIGTIAGALPWATWFPSDKNLKTNIKHIDTVNGIKIYSFSYIWEHVKSIGVMAQDLLKMPQYKDAVHMTSIGYVVDYSKLPI
jgi:hypothetical protein